MSTLLRLVGSVAVLSALVGSTFALGCSAESSDASDGAQTSDINGSLGNAQACAVRDAYTRATVSDFESIDAQHLPFALNLPSNAVRPLFAILKVSGIGNVYYVEYTLNSDGGTATLGAFYNATGLQLLRSSGTSSATAFFSPAGPLACGGGSSSTSSSGSSGWSSSSSSGSTSGTSGWTPPPGCYGAGCVPEAGTSSSSSGSTSGTSGWTPPPGCYGAGCVPEAGTP